MPSDGEHAKEAAKDSEISRQMVLVVVEQRQNNFRRDDALPKWALRRHHLRRCAVCEHSPTGKL